MDVVFKYILQSFPFCLVLSDISEPLLQKCAMIFEITFTEITACFSALEVGLLFCRCFGQVGRVLRLGLDRGEMTVGSRATSLRVHARPHTHHCLFSHLVNKSRR